MTEHYCQMDIVEAWTPLEDGVGLTVLRVRVGSVVSKPQAAFWASLSTLVRNCWIRLHPLGYEPRRSI